MDSWWQFFADSWIGYARYLIREITHPQLSNYFWWLVGLSAFVYSLELLRPWRRQQARLRRDFWLDAFYMFWNFFGFPLLGFVAASALVGHLWRDELPLPVVLDVRTWPTAFQWAVMFVLRDFLHWNVHRVLHRVPRLWEWHKVHHSVREMGFAAHLRYHWMETVLYRAAEAIPLAAIGFSVTDFFVVHILALTIGHLNHANLRVPLGPLRYVFNSAAMHIWHHARHLPADRPYGINFGISLSLWDFLFRTAHWPGDGRDIELGFGQLESFPDDLPHQLRWTPHAERSRG